MSQRLKLENLREKIKLNCTHLDLSFVHVGGKVGHDDFLGEDVAWHRRWASSCAPCGGLRGGLAGDSSLGSTSSATGTARIPPLLRNDLRKRLGIVGAEQRLLTSSRDLSRTIADAIRMIFRVIWSGTSEGSAKGVLWLLAGMGGSLFGLFDV